MINLDKHIWEGWTVRTFVRELEPILDMVQNGRGINPPMTTKEELKKWCMDNQPYYKKHIPELVDYFAEKYNLL